MTKQEATQLSSEADKYLGQSFIVSDGHGNDLERSEFVGTEENEVNGDYKPLAIFKSTKGDHWSRDLNSTLYLYKIWNDRK